MNVNDHLSKIFWILLILAAGLIVMNGIITEVSLGDESHHYRFAQNIYNTGKRVPFDPLYESGNPPGFYYNDPPLWHIGLAFLWKLTGGISQGIAQIYHVFFYILLIWATTLLAKKTIGEEGRWPTALIIATMPMVVSFSTLFYMDVPMTALSTLGFYMILKKRYIEAGVISGLMYFTKLNAIFFFPGFLFLIFYFERKNYWNLLKKLAYFSLPILIIFIPDLYWRKQNIINHLDISRVQFIVNRAISYFPEIGLGIKKYINSYTTIPVDLPKYSEYLNSYMTNPIDLAKYFGLTFLFLMILYLLRLRRWKKKSKFILIPIISYLIPFVILFGVHSDIRYLLPIISFLVVYSIPSFLSLGRIGRLILIVLCTIQFTSTIYYIQQNRQIPNEIKEGFEYIKGNVPENALILYPEENLLIYGERRMIWITMEGDQSGTIGLYMVFWGLDLKRIKDLLKANRIDYILIKNSRIYDDHEERHFGGYPKSFIEKLSHLEGCVKVFENSGVSLWKTDHS